MTDHRKWNGISVDKGLKDEWLEKINSVPRSKVVSTCEGHNKSERPHFNMEIKGPNAEKRALALKKKLSGTNTKTEVTTWRGTTVTRVNGKVREKYKEYDHGPKRVVLRVENKGRKSASWWDRTLGKI